MSGLVYLYYALMLACFGISLFYRRFALVKWLTALLMISILTEAVVEIIGTAQKNHYIVYHFFVPVEYTLVTLALRSKIINRRLGKIMLFSVFAFWPLTFYISFFLLSTSDFPGISAGIEGMLVIAWCLLTLVYIEPVKELSIFRLPVFWVALGFLLYFSGTMALNTVYNYLLHSRTQKAKDMFAIINTIFNCLLYIFLTIGILCHKEPTKSSVP